MQQCDNPKCDWNEYKRVVIETDRLQDIKNKESHKTEEKILETLTDIQVQIGKLQVKSGLWGALSGIVVTVGGLLFMFLKGVFKL